MSQTETTPQAAIEAINTVLAWIADDEIERRGLSDREHSETMRVLEDLRAIALEEME